MKNDKQTKLTFHITFKDFFKAFWKTIVIWIVIALIILAGIHFEIDETIIGGVVVIFGLLTQAFVGLIGIISLIPIIGPLIAKILALPVFWLINALGYFISIIAIKRGYSKDVINYRVLTVVLLVGIVIGFILGKIL